MELYSNSQAESVVFQLPMYTLRHDSIHIKCEAQLARSLDKASRQNGQENQCPYDKASVTASEEAVSSEEIIVTRIEPVFNAFMFM